MIISVGDSCIYRLESIGPTIMLIRTHDPIIAVARPHDLCLIPTLSDPISPAIEPGNREIIRVIRTVTPAHIPKAMKSSGATVKPK